VKALTVLGHSAELVRTNAAGAAGKQARDAANQGAQIVFACGGDGTVHEVLQGLVSDVAAPAAALGIIPMGSANALARHLRLSFDPVAAALQQVQGRTTTISVGKLEYGVHHRYFSVVAGAGPDGALMYELLASEKAGIGRLAYYWNALRLYLTHRFHPFEVEIVDTASGGRSAVSAVCAMTVRVTSMGGIFARLTGSGGTLEDQNLRLIIVRPPALISLPLWFLSGWCGVSRFNPLVKIFEVKEFSCLAEKGIAAHFEADGEWLGRLPMRISLMPNALRILIP
jgi:diacylglycerol kinase family enzyme